MSKDKHYVLTVDGRDYDYNGSGDVAATVAAIRASDPHKDFVARERLHKTIKTELDESGVPSKTLPSGKVVPDTNGESAVQYQERKQRLADQVRQDEIDKLKRDYDPRSLAPSVSGYPFPPYITSQAENRIQQLGGDKYTLDRLAATAVSQPSSLFTGNVHDIVLHAPSGGYGQVIEPGTDQTIANTPGFLGGVRDAAYGASSPTGLATLLTAPLLPEAYGAKALSAYFLASTAKGLGEQALDGETYKNDPGRYYGHLAAGLGLAALPLIGSRFEAAPYDPISKFESPVFDDPGLHQLTTDTSPSFTKPDGFHLLPYDGKFDTSFESRLSKDVRTTPEPFYRPAIDESLRGAGNDVNGTLLPGRGNKGGGYTGQPETPLNPNLYTKPDPVTSAANSLQTSLEGQGYKLVSRDETGKQLFTNDEGKAAYSDGEKLEYGSFKRIKAIYQENAVNPNSINNQSQTSTGPASDYLALAEKAKADLEAQGFIFVKQDAQGRQLFRSANDPSAGIYRSLDGNQQTTAYKSASRMFNQYASNEPLAQPTAPTPLAAANPVPEFVPNESNFYGLSKPTKDIVPAPFVDGSTPEPLKPAAYNPLETPDIIKQNQIETGVEPPAANEVLPPETPAAIDSLPKNPFISPETVAQVRDRLNNFFVENLSAFRREAPTSEAAIVKYASAPLIAENEARLRIPEVLSKFGSDAEAQQFQRYLVADAIDAKRVQLENPLSAAETKGEKRAIQSQLNDLAYQQKGGRLLDPVTNQPITEESLNEYFNRPSVKEAVASHKATVEPFLNENFINAGYDTNGTRGLRSDTFTPKLALDENGESPNPLRGNKLGTDTKLKDVPGSHEFTGTAEDYESDYATAIRQRFDAGTRASTQRQLITQLLTDGVAIDPAASPDKVAFNPVAEGNNGAQLQKLREQFPKIFGDGSEVKPLGKGRARHELTVNYNGQFEAGVTVDLARGFGGKMQEGIPNKIVIPTRFANELKSVFETYNLDRLDRAAQLFNGAFVEANLTGPGDAISHSVSLLSRSGNKVPLGFGDGLVSRVARGFGLTKTGVADSLAKAIPFVKLLHSVELLRSNTPEERTEATRYMAQNGVLPKDFPIEYNPNGSLLGKFKTSLGQFLYGDSGVLVNSATALYKFAKSQGVDLSTQEGQLLMRDMMRELNSNVKVLRPTLQRSLNSVGLGTFYQTGVKNRTSFFHQSPLNVVAGIVGAVATPVVLFKALDPEHRTPTEVPGYRLGDIPVGKDSQGRDKFFNYMKLSDKTASYATSLADSLLKSIANKDTPLHTGENLVSDGVNQFLGPAFSGPYGNAASALTGLAPHIAPNDHLNGFAPTPNNSAYTPLLSKERAVLTGQALLPQTALFGDYAELVSPTSLTPEDSHGLDRGLKLLGIPPVHNYQPASQILSSNRQKEANARRVGEHLKQRLSRF